MHHDRHGEGGRVGGEPSDGSQPAMMSFKTFLATQDDTISDEEAIKKYAEYKLEFKRQQLNEFFVSHKDEEWYVEFVSYNLSSNLIETVCGTGALHKIRYAQFYHHIPLDPIWFFTFNYFLSESCIADVNTHTFLVVILQFIILVDDTLTKIPFIVWLINSYLYTMVYLLTCP